MKVLIIENDPDIIKRLCVFLSGKGCNCETVTSSVLAEANLTNHYYDAIILHLTFLGRKEIQLLKFLKAARLDRRTVLTYEGPGVSLAQVSASGFQSLQKPYDPEALFERISAIDNYENVEDDQVFYFNELVVDVPGRSVQVKNRQVELTRTEFDLLHFLLQNQVRILGRTELAQYLSGEKRVASLSTGVLYAHVKNLKKKLRVAGCRNYIKTVYGIGYRFGRYSLIYAIFDFVLLMLFPDLTAVNYSCSR